MIQKNSEFELELVVDWLNSQNYKVIRPFMPKGYYHDGTTPKKLLKAAIIDTETTGINFKNDKIIELAFLIVEYCPLTGNVYKVLETYDELEDPCMPIPAESTKIHGITNDMVFGKRIMDSEVEKLMEEVSLVIAHNANFDRKFLEVRLPVFQKKAWACSFTQVDWKNEGINSGALEFIAYRCGFHYSGHRALMDCHALLEVLQSKLPISGTTPLKKLIDAFEVEDIKLWALNTNFKAKDILKSNGYRWDVEGKTWHKTISYADLEKEKQWLRYEVYEFCLFHIKQEITNAYNRFSCRPGQFEIIEVGTHENIRMIA